MEEKSLVKVQNEKIITAVTNQDALLAFVEEIKSHAEAFVVDVSTPAGRKATKSFCHRLTKSKTAVQRVSKEYVADAKLKIKNINESVKFLATTIDGIKDEKRKPLTEWEDQQSESDEIIKGIEAMASLEVLASITTSAEAKTKLDELYQFNPENVVPEKRNNSIEVANGVNKILMTLFETLKTSEENAAELTRLQKAESDRKAEEAKEAEKALQVKPEILEITAPPQIAPVELPMTNIDTQAEVTEGCTIPNSTIIAKNSVARPTLEEQKRKHTDVGIVESIDFRREAIEAIINKGLAKPLAIKVIDFIIAGEIPHIRMV